MSKANKTLNFCKIAQMLGQEDHSHTHNSASDYRTNDY